VAADQELSAAAPPRGVVHVVAISHLDTQWRWTIRDTIRRHLPKTLRENFAAFRDFRHYVVSFDGAFRYRLMQEYFPAAFAELRRWVALGRWAPVGSMWDAADVNLPSPESLVRQILYGRLWFRRELGADVRDLFLPDCFGFGWAWPSIAAHCSSSGFSSQKLSKDRGAIAIPFPLGVWEGPDGAELVAALDPGGYGEPLAGDPASDPETLAQLRRNGSAGVWRVLRYFGIGDTGGAPDRRSLRRLDESVAARGHLRVECGAAGTLFDALGAAEIARLPRHRGELLLSLHATGGYTSQAAMKRWNRRNEQLADAAERAAVAADWLGAQPYPRARLREAWQRFLWHQFHDDLPGTSVPAAYRYSWNDELLSLGQFAETLRASVGAVARGLDTRVEGLAVVVFNALSIERRDVVELRLPLAGGDAVVRTARVVGPRGEEEAAQVEPLGDGTARVLFAARLPPLGFAVFDLQLGREPSSGGAIAVSGARLENRRLAATLDARGDLASLVDRADGREALRRPARWELLRDTSLRFPAWEIHYRDVAAAPLGSPGEGARIRIVERGPVRVAIEVARRLGESSFASRYRLSDGGDSLEVDCEIDWRSRGCLLKAAFPAALAEDAIATYDLGLGAIERPVNRPKLYEVPAQQWADLTSPADGAGLAILDDCRYGWDRPEAATLRLTLLHTPRVGRRFRHQGSQDLGLHRLRYALAPHAGDWRRGDVVWQAARFNQPLHAYLAPRHSGPLGRELSLLASSSRDVAVRALKMAEETDEAVVRLQELTGRPARTRLAGAVAILGARLVDGAEGPAGRIAEQALEDGGVAVELGGFAAPRGQPVTLPFDLDVMSRDDDRRDGAFDRRGRTLPGELVPAELVVHGLRFVFGSSERGARNALSCREQAIALPAGRGRRLYALAAAAGGRRRMLLRLGEGACEWWIEEWLGGVRAFDGAPRAGDVAWIGTHHHTRRGDEPYGLCCLFLQRAELPDEVTELRLPRQRGVRILAMTVAENPNDDLAASGVPYH
jgi:alpha-mannosidase